MTVPILLLCLAVLLIPVRLLILYDENGFRTEVRIGFIRLNSSRKETRTGQKQTQAHGGKKGGSMQSWREQWEIISRALGKLWHRVRVRELTLYYCHAAEDPAAAALGYGAASAAAAAILNVLKKTLRIQTYDIRAEVSFTETKPKLFLRLRLYMPVVGVLGTIAHISAETRKAGSAHAKE